MRFEGKAREDDVEGADSCLPASCLPASCLPSPAPAPAPAPEREGIFTRERAEGNISSSSSALRSLRSLRIRSRPFTTRSVDSRRDLKSKAASFAAPPCPSHGATSRSSSNDSSVKRSARPREESSYLLTKRRACSAWSLRISSAK